MIARPRRAVSGGAMSGGAMSGGAVLLVAALVVAGACGGEDERAAQVASGPARRESGGARHAGESVEVTETAPDQPPARLAHAEGDVARSRGPIAEGAPLERGDGLIVGPGGRADVDLTDGGRVSLEAESELRIGDGGPAQVVLVEGALHAAVPAGPAGPRPPLRIATANASMDLGGSGELFVRAHRSGAVWIASLAGVVTVATGETDARRRLRVIELPPGRAILVGTRLAEPTDGPTRLTDARAAAVMVFETAAAPEPARIARELDDHASRLDESLHWLELETRRGLDLTTQHRAAVRAGRSDEGMRLQRELVTHSQQLYALRQVATARWERVAAGTMLVSRVPGTTPAHQADARRDRVASLLGL